MENFQTFCLYGLGFCARQDVGRDHAIVCWHHVCFQMRNTQGKQEKCSSKNLKKKQGKYPKITRNRKI